MFRVIYDTIAEAVKGMVDVQGKAILADLQHLICSYDAAHDGVVAARHTRGVLVVQNDGEHNNKVCTTTFTPSARQLIVIACLQVVKAMSSSEGAAQGRETPLLKEIMQWAKEHGCDIVECW